jgi:hypothetical protein
MWIRRAANAQARMPSMRQPPLNPGQPGQAAPQHKADANKPASASASADEETEDAAAARAGGFHESSYELRHGLQISESEWPDDVTVPGGLGER